MKRISCIIPAFNEEKQIAAVLDVVLETKQKNSMEIIVIDDGSSDQTSKILSKYKGVRIITNKQNKGKSYSIAMGLEVSKGDSILLLDADLIGLTSENILALLAPVQSDAAEVTMSIRKNSFILMRKIKLDYVTGERVFPRALVDAHIEDMKNLPNFALEVFLNNLTIKNKCAIKTVYWNNVSNNYKYKKRGFYSGLKAETKMFSDILKIVPATGLIRHNVALKKLLVKS